MDFLPRFHFRCNRTRLGASVVRAPGQIRMLRKLLLPRLGLARSSRPSADKLIGQFVESSKTIWVWPYTKGLKLLLRLGYSPTVEGQGGRKLVLASSRCRCDFRDWRSSLTALPHIQQLPNPSENRKERFYSGKPRALMV